MYSRFLVASLALGSTILDTQMFVVDILCRTSNLHHSWHVGYCVYSQIVVYWRETCDQFLLPELGSSIFLYRFVVEKSSACVECSQSKKCFSRQKKALSIKVFFCSVELFICPTHIHEHVLCLSKAWIYVYLISAGKHRWIWWTW